MIKREQEIISITKEAMEKFIRDWQNFPYQWNNEIDIQVELATRFKKILKTNSIAIQKAIYKGTRRKGLQNYSRLCCEPLTYYKNGNKRYPCYPDIVIYDKLKNCRRPPDDNDRRRNWPMLLVCEIKYQNEFSGGCSRDNKKWDTDKMKFLLLQDDKTKYACCLDFDRITEGIRDDGIEFISDVNGRLWKYKITLPTPKRINK